jgi:hypothetical protein
MMWTDRIALGFLELLAVAMLIFLAINYFTSANPLTASKVYGSLVGGGSLVILPLWLVLRVAERRGSERRQ